MNLNELPRDLAQFVQQEIAQGTYPSAAEAVSAALRLLRAHKAQCGNGQSAANGDPDALPCAAEAIVEAITKAAIPAHRLVASTHDLTGTFCGRFTPPVGSYAGCMRSSMVRIAVAKHRNSCSG